MRKAFAHTGAYDSTIASTMNAVEVSAGSMTRRPAAAAPQPKPLRYGENPHQQASWIPADPAVLTPWAVHQGKELSFTNLLDLDAAARIALEFDEPADLYEVIRQRYEKGSMIVTSNRALEEWAPLFGDQLLASAAMDRLLHHAHVVVIQGRSYRNPPGERAAS